MAKSNVINPYDVLKDKEISIREKYETYKQKINTYLSLAAIIVTVVLFILQSKLSEISFIFDISKDSCSIKLLKIVTWIILSCTTLGIIILFIKLLLLVVKALQPITLQEIDFESIELHRNGKKKDAYSTLLNDLIKSISFNENTLNDKYSYLFSMNRLSVYLIVLSFILLLIILIISVVKELV
jgi:hypothetical protein